MCLLDDGCCCCCYFAIGHFALTKFKSFQFGIVNNWLMLNSHLVAVKFQSVKFLIFWKFFEFLETHIIDHGIKWQWFLEFEAFPIEWSASTTIALIVYRHIIEIIIITDSGWIFPFVVKYSLFRYRGKSSSWHVISDYCFCVEESVVVFFFFFIHSHRTQNENRNENFVEIMRYDDFIIYLWAKSTLCLIDFLRILKTWILNIFRPFRWQSHEFHD